MRTSVLPTSNQVEMVYSATELTVSTHHNRYKPRLLRQGALGTLYIKETNIVREAKCLKDA